MVGEKRITHEYALEKAKEIVGKMTLQEKAEQLTYKSAPVKRLGIPRYNWWNEGLHGVARAGTATVFPQAIGLAAMFDDELLHDIAEVISTEGRAKYNESSKKEDRDIYKGITYWSPNVNACIQRRISYRRRYNNSSRKIRCCNSLLRFRLYY